ncbi:hypothetical protein T439DRAFT_351574 [Meredithblackwellia eburnea MCA 4105]
MTQTVAQYVEGWFHRFLYQPEDSIAIKALEELSPDAIININGDSLTAQAFIDFIQIQFRGTQHGAFVSSTDLAFSPLDPEGRTGVISQQSRYTTTSKSDGSVVASKATTIVKVEDVGGKRVVTALWEVAIPE